MPDKKDPPIIATAQEYKNYLLRQAILEYTDRLKNHIQNNDRNYLSFDIDWLIVRIYEIDNADFEKPDDDNNVPF